MKEHNFIAHVTTIIVQDKILSATTEYKVLIKEKRNHSMNMKCFLIYNELRDNSKYEEISIGDVEMNTGLKFRRMSSG
jgi:hypothetical protein